MTKIYYDENDKKAVQLIEDYYWFKYYLKSFHFDVVSNPQIMNLLNKGWDEDNINKVYYLVNQLVNKDEFLRFLELMDMLFHHREWNNRLTYSKEEQIFLLLFYLDNDDKAMFLKIFKDKLIKLYGKV